MSTWTHRWVVQFAAGAFFSSLAIMLLGYHLAFGVPIKSLVTPWLLSLSLTVILSPALLWARARKKVPQTRAVFALAFGSYFMLTWLLLVFYAVRFGIISRADASSYYVALLVAMPVAIIGAYYGHRSASKTLP